MKTRKLTRLLIFSILFSFLSIGQASAISEGGSCNSSKFGNSLVMSNGKIHGGLFGSNANYAGPLYLCDGAVWIYWETAKPKSKSKGNSSLVNVAPGEICTAIGKTVNSKNFGKLKCMYVRVGRLQTLMWMRT
jgi:hypothetical protein